MQINDKDAGAYLKVVSGFGARGLAGGTGDATEVLGAIVDQLAHEDLRSGCIVICGSATLAEDKVLALGDIKIEHGDEDDLSDVEDYEYADFCAPASVAAQVTGGSGGSTEIVEYKQRVNLQGVKRYWRVAFTPDLDATGTDVFTLGGGVVLIGGEAPLTQ